MLGALPGSRKARAGCGDQVRVSRELLVREVKEKDFQQMVEELFRLKGWLVYHTLRSKGSEPGFPDLVMLKDGRLVVAELKTEKGRISAPQFRWIEEFSLVAEAEVHLWRPSDWEEIERVACA